MSLQKTRIPYADVSWSPVTGCSHAHTGCANCYAERLAATRLRHLPQYAGLTENGRWNGKVRFNAAELERPLATKKPKIVFMPLAGDVFHESATCAQIDSIFNVVRETPHHTYLLFTKRPSIARVYWKRVPASYYVPPNVICYYSASDQASLDAGIADHLATPWAKHGLSLEPLVGPVDVGCSLPSEVMCARCGWFPVEGMPEYMRIHGDTAACVVCATKLPAPSLSHVIVGGESGPCARPMHPQWARDVRDACAAAGVPFYFKQWGEWIPDLETCPDRPDDDPEQSRFETCVWDTESNAWERTNGTWDDREQWIIADNYSDPEQGMTRIGTRRAGNLLDGAELREVAW